MAADEPNARPGRARRCLLHRCRGAMHDRWKTAGLARSQPEPRCSNAQLMSGRSAVQTSKMNATLQRRVAALAVIALVTGALMALHAPGHMSWDSLVQLDEGLGRKYLSWNPPSFSLFLGGTYALFGSTSAALLVSQSLLVFATFRLSADPGESTSLRAAACVSALAVPVVLIYAGILWKDVYFAHLALTGFAVLNGDRVEKRHLVLAAMLLGAASTVRQQGAVLLVPLLVYAFMSAATDARSSVRRPWAPAVLAIGGFLCAYLLVNALVRYTAIEMPGKPYRYGVNLIQRYDIAGIVYRDTGAPLDEFAKWPGFDRNRYVEFIGQAYSPQRLDFLDLGGPFHVGEERSGVVRSQWRSLIAARPLTYLAHRKDVFGWMLGANDPTKCLPFIDGIVPGPREVMARLNFQVEPHPIASRLTQWIPQEIFRPYAYLASGALATGSLLLWRWRRRRQADGIEAVRDRRAVMSGPAIPLLYLAALLYALAHFFIGIACDFRYMYFPVLASIVVTSHVAWHIIAGMFASARRRVAGR